MASKRGKPQGRRAKKKAGARRKALGLNPGADKALRQHLVALLSAEQAHINFEKSVAEFPGELRGKKPDGFPYSAWQLLEHLRIAQWDILEFSRNPNHVSPHWPDGYWPASAAPSDDAAWDRSVKSFLADRSAMERLVRNPRTDLFARIPHGDGQTILREAMLTADHNAYHVGQIVLLRKLFQGS